MLQPPRLTVWSSIEELESLKALLYEHADGNDGRPRALEIIRAWSARGRLPHAIESTAHLTECFLHDTPRQSELMVRMGYATAICRFVNGLLDPAQKSRFAVSMYNLAQEQGLPASFVDVRHAATHEALPSIGVLRTTASRALDWLWVHYWDRIDASGGVEDGIGENIGKPVDQAQISRVQALLDRWGALKKGAQGRPREATRRKMENEEAGICTALAGIFKESAGNGLFLEILVHEHLLVMEESGSMMSIYKTTNAWKPLIQHLDAQIEEFATDLLNIVLEALQEVEDSEANGRDDFAETESEYTYQWLEFLISLLIKGQLAAASATLLDDIVSRCILSQNLWCLRLAEYAISQSSVLETKYSQACTAAKKQLANSNGPQRNPDVPATERADPHCSKPDKNTDTDVDMDKELEDFEAKLRSLQAQREQWAVRKALDVSVRGSGTTALTAASQDASTVAPSGSRAARFRRAEGSWVPKPMGIA
ncbi:rRNA-processing protein las1 [Orbilia brochopaga]|uniref:rRNA-processing protein las1 n=1 Tax=Orbilia brochopaga TaxID=3140254 RepID=A0AAV9UW92_9PEZI